MISQADRTERGGLSTYSLRLGVEVRVFARFCLDGVEPSDRGALRSGRVGHLDLDLLGDSVHDTTMKEGQKRSEGGAIAMQRRSDSSPLQG